MDIAQLTSVTIFVVALGIIISEKIHRAVVALAGAVLVMMLGIMPFEEAVGHIDFNTLGVLFGGKALWPVRVFGGQVRAYCEGATLAHHADLRAANGGAVSVLR